MSRLIYNGVELSYIRTQSFEFNPVYDDAGVDYLWTEVNIQVEAIMSGTAAPAQGGETPTQTMVRVRGLLETPRRTLQFFVNTNALLDTTVTPDVKTGPIPGPVTINQISEATFMVSFKITTYIAECPAGSAPPAYISHRWKETVSIDENFYTTKTRTGKIYSRTDINTNADSLRGLVIPPIDNGFKVTKIEVTLQEDGLALMYSFEEKEVFLQPPAPATKAEGDYIESSTTPGGAIRTGEVRVRLEGAKNSDTGALLQRAVLIAVTKVSPDGPIATKGNEDRPTKLVAAAVRQSMWENKVEVNLKVQYTSTPSRIKGVAMDLKRFTVPPVGSEPGTLPPDPGLRGTAGLQLVAAAFQDPCSSAAILNTGGLGTTSTLSTTGLPEVHVLMTTVLPDDSRALYSTTLDNLPGFYTNYQIHVTNRLKTWNVQLPVAAPNQASAIVTLASGTGERIVEWSAEKTGNPPKIPDYNTSDPNLVLLSAELMPSPNDLNPGEGTMVVFRRAGRYVYAEQDPSKSPVDGGMPPFIDPSIRQAAVINPDDLIHGIIDGASGTSTLSTVPGSTFPGQ
jgi:hypothetical protein